MVVDVCVLHHHGPVLVVPVKDQSQSHREGSREQDVFLGEPGDQPLHHRPGRKTRPAGEAWVSGLVWAGGRWPGCPFLRGDFWKHFPHVSLTSSSWTSSLQTWQLGRFPELLLLTFSCVSATYCAGGRSCAHTSEPSLNTSSLFLCYILYFTVSTCPTMSQHASHMTLVSSYLLGKIQNCFFPPVSGGWNQLNTFTEVLYCETHLRYMLLQYFSLLSFNNMYCSYAFRVETEH